MLNAFKKKEGNKKETAQADSTGKKPSHRHRVDSEFHCFA